MFLVLTADALPCEGAFRPVTPSHIHVRLVSALPPVTLFLTRTERAWLPVAAGEGPGAPPCALVRSQHRCTLTWPRPLGRTLLWRTRNSQEVAEMHLAANLSALDESG